MIKGEEKRRKIGGIRVKVSLRGERKKGGKRRGERVDAWLRERGGDRSGSRDEKESAWVVRGERRGNTR